MKYVIVKGKLNIIELRCSRLVVAKVGEGSIGSFGLADANYYV